MNRASACAKLILLGEHAVLYGYPALAVPLPHWRATVTVAPHSEPGVKIESPDLGETRWVTHLTPLSKHPLELTVQHVLLALQESIPQVQLTIASQIPQARGLGSGAAVTIALVRALLQYFSKNLTEKDQLALIHQIETLYHGQASGIDSHVCFYEKPMCFVMGEPPAFFEFAGHCPLLLADTGPSPPTREVVKTVKIKVGQNPDFFYPLFRTVSQAVNTAQTALVNGQWDVLGQEMSRNHKALQAMGVSSLMLDQAFHAALNAGAYGAKLTGGGRGGMCVILTPSDKQTEVREAVQAAGVETIYPFELSGTLS